MTMVQFYKHDIAPWRGGTVMLSDRAYRVYHVLVEEIMLNEGPAPLHERSLAGKANRSVRDFRAAMEELIGFGKITVRGGFVHNSRCENELNSIRTNREHASNGGRNSGEVRKKAIVLNGGVEAPLPSAMKPKREEKEIEKKEEISVPSEPRPKKVRTQYPEEFETFWSGYPTDVNMSKKEAFDAWKRMGAEARQDAVASLPAFRAYCQANVDYRPIHAGRFLLKARFEGFLKVAQQAAVPSVYIKRTDPAWSAWDAFYRKTKGQAPPTDAAGGWRFPSETPPQEQVA
jgi:uncharacterized protein YdaU (DUF1376 family)